MPPGHRLGHAESMAVRNLYRQTRPFRVLGWCLFALVLGVVLVVSPQHLESWQVTSGLLLALLGAVALDALKFCTKFVPGQRFDDAAVVRFLRVELLVVPGFLLLLQFPIALIVPVAGVLINANVALGGRRALLLSLGLCASSVGVTLCLQLAKGAPVTGPQETAMAILSAEDTLWISGLLFLLVFTTALSEIGFRLTQKLDDHRQQWQDRFAILQPFVPQGLTDSGPAQERRWITVVMVDLVEFTTRSSPLPPEVIGTVLDDLLDEVVRKANDAGGTLDKFMGDGVLLFFSAQSGRSQAVQSALQFVLLLLREMPRLNARWQGYGVQDGLKIRSGIASGYCSVGQWGRSDVRAYTMVGSCVGLAERLQAISDENSLAVCPVSARLLLEPLANSRLQTGDLPATFQLSMFGRQLLFTGSRQALKGFAQMRVYRLSDKVRRPSHRAV